jgi:hypothetical protein
MLRFTTVSVAVVLAGGLVAAPAPSEIPAKVLVAGLSDPDEKVRDASSAALKGRSDALPWLRRAARSKTPITAARAEKLLAPHEKLRQEAVAGAIDACVRDGRIDVLTEWHQYWNPKAEEDLWAVGPRATKAGFDLYAKSCPKEAGERFEKAFAWTANLKAEAHDGPCPDRFPLSKGAWVIRTDRLDGRGLGTQAVRFASVAGPARVTGERGSRYLVLGSVEATRVQIAFVAVDGGISSKNMGPSSIMSSVVVCRGNLVGGHYVVGSVILVDGDIDLTRASDLRNSLIRATGEIRLPKGVTPDECTIEAGVKDATAPYRFFTLSDVGLSVADGDGALAVTAVKPGTPFGDCGLEKEDVIKAIDDVPAGRASEFRQLVRRALVRQGDCLLTVTRGDKTIDLPVFFPLPK